MKCSETFFAAPSKPAGYNLDFMDKLDDPNFDPFATKSKVTNESLAEDQQPSKSTVSSYNVDFLDNLDDPNFNPFETKSKVSNNFDGKMSPEELPALELCEKPKMTTETPVKKDSTPEFEQAEKMINDENVAKDGKDADLKEPFNKLEQLINEESISDTLEAEFQDSDFAEPSFLLSAPIVSHPDVKDAKDGQDAVPNFSNPNQPDPFSPSSSAFSSRSLISEPIKDVKDFKDGKDARILSENVKETLARNELIYQSQLLEKDKELHAKEMEIQKIDQQVSALKRELKSINDGNSDMM